MYTDTHLRQPIAYKHRANNRKDLVDKRCRHAIQIVNILVKLLNISLIIGGFILQGGGRLQNQEKGALMQINKAVYQGRMSSAFTLAVKHPSDSI